MLVRRGGQELATQRPARFYPARFWSLTQGDALGAQAKTGKVTSAGGCLNGAEPDAPRDEESHPVL